MKPLVLVVQKGFGVGSLLGFGVGSHSWGRSCWNIVVSLVWGHSWALVENQNSGSWVLEFCHNSCPLLFDLNICSSRTLVLGHSWDLVQGHSWVWCSVTVEDRYCVKVGVWCWVAIGLFVLGPSLSVFGHNRGYMWVWTLCYSWDLVLDHSRGSVFRHSWTLRVESH